MATKLMWTVEIKGFNTDIHGRAYALTKEEAISRLREIALDDLEKLKEKESWRDWYASIKENGLSGYVYSSSGCADDWDYEKGVDYMVCRKRISV